MANLGSLVDVGSGRFLLAEGLNFGDHLEQLKSALKVVKDLHGIPEVSPPKPAVPRPDVHLALGRLAVAFADSSFEAALWQNYVVHRDEVLERGKREALLAAQIAAQGGQLRDPQQTQQLLEAALMALQKENSALFCRRVQAFRANTPVPPLFDVVAVSLRLTLVADLAFAGTAALLARMVDIDGSPIAGQEWSLLLGSKCVLCATSLTLRLRDYTLPLAELTGLRIHGGLVLAEPDAAPEGCRDDTVDAAAGETYRVSKGMTPIKVCTP